MILTGGGGYVIVLGHVSHTKSRAWFDRSVRRGCWGSDSHDRPVDASGASVSLRQWAAAGVNQKAGPALHRSRPPLPAGEGGLLSAWLCLGLLRPPAGFNLTTARSFLSVLSAMAMVLYGTIRMIELIGPKRGKQ
jgi:hypothetical protein